MNGDGTLVTAQGYPVLGNDGGEIAIPENARDIRINGGGQILADGEDIGQVGIMEFANEKAMRRMGNQLLQSDENPLPSETARVVQGSVEAANVSPVTEMVRVMELTRSTTSTAKFIEVMYDLQRKTASTYARQQS